MTNKKQLKEGVGKKELHTIPFKKEYSTATDNVKIGGIATNTSCFWTHNWGKWVETERGNTLHSGTSRVQGKYLIQERMCLSCGKKELNEQQS